MKTITKIIASIFLVATISSCNDKNILEPAPQAAAKTIGESYGGGTIFYVDGSGQHGLIAAPEDDISNVGNGATVTSFTLQVSGMTGNVGSNINYVSISLNHSYVGNVVLQLKAPNGATIYLSNQNGGSGQNYSGTIFKTGYTPIASGTAPFQGYYAPSQAFSTLSSSAMNGIWTLLITNYSTIYHGALTEFSLGFTTNTFPLSILVSKKWDKGLNISSNAFGSSVGSGQSNTTNIISSLGYGGYAARVCEDLNINGYSDWYLPSLDELSLMKDNKTIIPNINTSGIYWSSTEVSSVNAYAKGFNTGNDYNYSKSTACRVRAIRSF